MTNQFINNQYIYAVYHEVFAKRWDTKQHTKMSSNTAINKKALLEALPPICMRQTTRDESQMVNTAGGEAKCHVCHEILIKSCIFSYKRSGSVFQALYCILHPFINTFNK